MEITRLENGYFAYDEGINPRASSPMLGKHSTTDPHPQPRTAFCCLLKILWKENWLQMFVVIQGGLWKHAKLSAHKASHLIFGFKEKEESSFAFKILDNFFPWMYLLFGCWQMEKATEWAGQICQNGSQSRGSLVNWCYGQLILYPWPYFSFSLEKKMQ